MLGHRIRNSLRFQGARVYMFSRALTSRAIIAADGGLCGILSQGPLLLPRLQCKTCHYPLLKSLQHFGDIVRLSYQWT